MSPVFAALTESSIASICSVALLALLLEVLFPIPQKFHPLSAAQLLARRMANKVRPKRDSARQQQLISGALSYFVLFGPILVVLSLLISFAEYAYFFELLILWAALSFSAQKMTFNRVMNALKKEKKLLARQWVSTLVKRDTQSLSDIGIAKAAMESLLLRFVYQVVTTLFAFFAFGAVSALAYRLALVCYWEWKRPYSVQSAFAAPMNLMCKVFQLIPIIFTVLISWFFVLPRSTQKQQRESVKVSSAKTNLTGMSGLLFSVLGKRLGFTLGGPLEYNKGTRVRLPRLGAPYQVRLSDMAAVNQTVNALILIIGLMIVLAGSLSLR